MSAESLELAKRLSAAERRVLRACPEAGPPVALEGLAGQAGMTPQEAYSALSWLQQKGLVTLEERAETRVRLGPSAAAFVRDGFPERRVYEFAKARPAGTQLSELNATFDPDTINVALAWWKRKGLGSIERQGATTILRAAPSPPPAEDEQFLRELVASPDGGGQPEARVRAANSRAYDALRSRPGLLETQTVKQRLTTLTPEGRQARTQLATAGELVGELTPELIKSGAWRGKEFQAYDVRTAPVRATPYKPHPLVQIIEEIKEIFVQLGFQEIEEDYVQSAFWNLDALFIPQDHPAREMQDTFYLEHPAQLPILEDVFARISKVHQTGGGTGSRGWGQRLDPEESKKALLRTHTTVGTIRYIAAQQAKPEPERDPVIRVFSVGRVFRHETMDATHLPEFHQVEGIATEPGADFPMLLGLLQEFFRRLGFPKLRWRPAYFPYTEPSMEVEVWTGTKWMELGGCGVFRPEVTHAFGVKTPVLAWGLGLERLAMMRLGLKDIRDLYVSDLEWLRNQPLA